MKLCRGTPLFASQKSPRLAVRQARTACVVRAAATAQAEVRVRSSGSSCVQGTSRKRNEDRYVVDVRTHLRLALQFPMFPPSSTDSLIHCRCLTRQQTWESRLLTLAFSTGMVRACGQSKVARHLQRPALSHHADTGGDATASWLVDNLADYVEKHWESGGKTPELDITEAFVKARPAPLLVNSRSAA